jgi:hypothetical protein
VPPPAMPPREESGVSRSKARNDLTRKVIAILLVVGLVAGLLGSVIAAIAAAD